MSIRNCQELKEIIGQRLEDIGASWLLASLVELEQFQRQNMPTGLGQPPILVTLRPTPEPLIKGVHGDRVPASFVYLDYLEKIHQAGGRAIMAHWSQPKDIPNLLRSVGGILLPGGLDLCQATHGGEHPGGQAIAHPGRKTNEELDQFEVLLALSAVYLGIPILGICRGMQILAAAFGVGLHEVAGHEANQPIRQIAHAVTIEPRSPLTDIMEGGCNVNSVHNWAVMEPDENTPVRVIGRAPDGVIEAIEIADASGFAFGVQWHPEAMEGQHSFFASFVQATLRTA